MINGEIRLQHNLAIDQRIKTFAKIVSDCRCTNFQLELIALENALQEIMDCLYKLRLENQSLYLVGNGGSAAIASHALVDFINVAKIRAQVLHESSLITCMSNDYGYENAYSRLLATCIKPGDILVGISSSGKSSNICNAAKMAKDKGAKVITLSGFNETNPLRHLGDFNFWLDSTDYGYVEIGHQFILHNLADRFNKAFY